MNLSAPKDCSEGGVDPSPFTVSDVVDPSFTIQPSSSQGCPPTRTPIVQMSSRSDNEQTKYIRSPDIRKFCDSVASRQDQTPSFTHACDYGASEQLWHQPLLNDDVVRLSSLLPPSLLTSAYPAHLLLTGRSFLDSRPASVAARSPIVLPQAVHAKDPAFSSDGSSLSLDGYHKLKYFKDSTQVADTVEDGQKESDDENRIDVCNIKEASERESVSPTPMQDQNIEKYEENSEDDSTSPTSLAQLEGQCARTVPGLLKYYSRHKWSLSSSLTVSLAVTGQSTPPSSPISPGTFQRPIVSSAQLNEGTITVNSCDEDKSKVKNMETELTSSCVPLLTVPKSNFISSSLSPLSSLKNISSHRPVSKVLKSTNGDMTEKAGKKSYPKCKPFPDIARADKKGTKSCEKSTNSSMLEAPNVANISDAAYTSALPIGMENLATHFPLGPSTYHPDDISRHNSLLLSQGIDPNMAARIGLGYQFVRDPVTGHIILLPNPHHLPSTNPSLLWTGYGGVAASSLMMAPQQLLLNEPHYRHPMHPHLLHVNPHPMQLEKSSSSLKPLNSTRPNDLALPDLPSASIPPHILYPSNTMPCYLTRPSQQILPLTNFNTQVDNLISVSATPPDNGSTVTTNSKSCSPIAVNIPNDYNPKPMCCMNKNLKVLQDPKHNKVPVDLSTMEPPMDLTKKKKSSETLEQQEENRFQPISINTDSFALTYMSTKPISVKKEIKEEILSPNLSISHDKHKNSFHSFKLKEECFADTSESISNHSKEQSANGTEKISFSIHSPVSTTLNWDPEAQQMSFEEEMDVSGLNLLSHSIQQHEDIHHMSASNSDEEMSCIEMPTLEKINLSPSPRHSPVSCELPPVLTPVEITGANHVGHRRKTDNHIVVPSSMATQYSGLSILCVLAEQELNEKINNCSALTSLAEVAAAHGSIKEPADCGDSLPKRHISEPCEDKQLREIQTKVIISEETDLKDAVIPEDNWSSSTDINRNYTESRTMNKDGYYVPKEKKIQSSLFSEKMNGREIKFRIQLAELQRKYKKKKQKLTKLHKKCISKKNNRTKLQQQTEDQPVDSYETQNDKLSTESNYHKFVKGSSNEMQTNSVMPEEDTLAVAVLEDESTKWCDNSPIINLAEEACGIETISDTDQHCPSSKRKPGRPKKLSVGDDELLNSKQNLDFMMVSHKPKILPKLRAELKIRETDPSDEIYDNCGITCKEDLSDDDLPLATIQLQQKSAEKLLKKSTLTNNIKILSHKKRALTRRAILRDKEKRKKSIEKQSNLQELFRSLKRHSKMAAEGHDESDEEKDTMDRMDSSPVSLNNEDSPFPGFQNIFNSNYNDAAFQEFWNDSPAAANEISSSCLIRRDTTDMTVCQLKVEDLVDKARVLVRDKGMLYAGGLVPISPPNTYKINIDGERVTRALIYCQQDLLSGVWKEVKPGSTRFLKEGTRVCAFWSQQNRALYTGKIAAASYPSSEENHNLVNVEFDDEDVRRIHIDDVRLLPRDFPICIPEDDLMMAKRKRRLNSTQLTDEPQPSCSEISGGVMDDNVDLKTDLVTNSNDGVVDKNKRRKHSDEHKHKRKHKKNKRKKSKMRYSRVDQDGIRLKIKFTSPSRSHYDANRNVDNEEETESTLSLSSSKETDDCMSNEETYDGERENKRKHRNSTEKSKIASFLPEDQLWKWADKGIRRGKSKKEFHKEIWRKNERIKVGDCAVFLSTGKPDRPFIGEIEFLWGSRLGKMEVKVKWFYHPEETVGLNRSLEPMGLFESNHRDQNDLQTISHICFVVPLQEYRQLNVTNDACDDTYYLAGYYDAYAQKIVIKPGV